MSEAEINRISQELHELKEVVEKLPRREAVQAIRGWLGVGVICVTALFWLFNLHAKLEHHVEEPAHKGQRDLNEVIIELRINQKRILEDLQTIKKGMPGGL